jgi:hypothetical protein
MENICIIAIVEQLMNYAYGSQASNAADIIAREYSV